MQQLKTRRSVTIHFKKWATWSNVFIVSVII